MEWSLLGVVKDWWVEFFGYFVFVVFCSSFIVCIDCFMLFCIGLLVVWLLMWF